MKPYPMPTTACPYCSLRLNANAYMYGPGYPAPGDVTLCIGCAAVLFFNAQLLPCKPAAGELAAFQATAMWPKVQKLQEAIRTLSAIERHLRG